MKTTPDMVEITKADKLRLKLYMDHAKGALELALSSITDHDEIKAVLSARDGLVNGMGIVK